MGIYNNTGSGSHDNIMNASEEFITPLHLACLLCVFYLGVVLTAAGVISHVT